MKVTAKGADIDVLHGLRGVDYYDLDNQENNASDTPVSDAPRFVGVFRYDVEAA